MGTEGGTEGERLAQAKTGQCDVVASMSWSGLCLGPKPGTGESSKGEENSWPIPTKGPALVLHMRSPGGEMEKGGGGEWWLGEGM